MNRTASGSEPRLPAAAAEGAAPFHALLERLAQDAPAAASAYEALRERLILFFRLHVPAQADALADITLDRLARRVHDGTPVENLRLYALGIARKVVQEAYARQRRDQRIGEDPSVLPEAEREPDDDSETLRAATLAALGACLDAVSAEAREAILLYYGADVAQRIRLRQRLAAQAGISLNALRNRAQRLREALERCVRERLGIDGVGP